MTSPRIFARPRLGPLGPGWSADDQYAQTQRRATPQSHSMRQEVRFGKAAWLLL